MNKALYAFVIFALTLVSATAQETGKKKITNDSFKLPQWGGYRLSPDNSRVAFTKRERDEEGELTPAHMELSSYHLIQIPASSTIRILESWECPNCPGPKWATIEIGGGVIRAIVATRVDRSTFEASHYISHEAIDIAKYLTSLPYDELVDLDIVEILREKL